VAARFWAEGRTFAQRPRRVVLEVDVAGSAELLLPHEGSGVLPREDFITLDARKCILACSIDICNTNFKNMANNLKFDY
jgi:hypothetical protein